MWCACVGLYFFFYCGVSTSSIWTPFFCSFSLRIQIHFAELSLCWLCGRCVFFGFPFRFHSVVILFHRNKNRFYYLSLARGIINCIVHHQLITYSLLTQWGKWDCTKRRGKEKKNANQSKKEKIREKWKGNENNGVDFVRDGEAWFWLVQSIDALRTISSLVLFALSFSGLLLCCCFLCFRNRRWRH